MAIHNTFYDVANTAVRVFLTKVGATYWRKTFNTGLGSDKEIWNKVKNIAFHGKRCYCGKASDKLQIKHLIKYNREEYGLYHPGNVVPVYSDCNKRDKVKRVNIYLGRRI